MVEDERWLLSRFLEIVQKLGLSDLDVSAVSGLAPSTVRMARRGGVIPKHPRARRAFVAFVDLGRAAKSRDDLRLGTAS